MDVIRGEDMTLNLRYWPTIDWPKQETVIPAARYEEMNMDSDEE